MNWHMLEAIDSAKSSPSGPKTLLLFWRICLTTASRWGLPSWVNSSHFIVVAFAGAGTPDVVVDVVVVGLGVRCGWAVEVRVIVFTRAGLVELSAPEYCGWLLGSLYGKVYQAP